MEYRGGKLELTKKELKILISIFKDTDFDGEFQTKELLRELDISQDPIFQKIKDFLIEQEALIRTKKIGSVDFFKIDYRKLAELIKQTDIFKMFENIDIKRL